jgi:uncharacterized membrane protein YdbT with pleckstrin-like domain
MPSLNTGTSFTFYLGCSLCSGHSVIAHIYFLAILMFSFISECHSTRNFRYRVSEDWCSLLGKIFSREQRSLLTHTIMG